MSVLLSELVVVTSGSVHVWHDEIHQDYIVFPSSIMLTLRLREYEGVRCYAHGGGLGWSDELCCVV